MNFTRPFLSVLSFTTLALALSACGISKLGGGGTAGNGGSGGGNGGGGAGSGVCEGSNPSDNQCVTDADCSPDQICSLEACAPSGCACDAESASWLCTADCSPGCMPGGHTCSGPDPSAGSCHEDADCQSGQTCALGGCQSSSCDCTDGGWLCTDDCAGSCVPDSSACEGENPQGCKLDGCDEGQVCVIQGCVSSGCACDASSGLWVCDADCGGGECVPETTVCSGPNPAGCKSQGCPPDQVCVETGCTPSDCGCDPQTGGWYCTDDCGGGECQPVP